MPPPARSAYLPLEGLRDVPTEILGRGNVPLSKGEELLPLYREEDLRAFPGDLERSLYGRRCHSGADGYGPVAFHYADANHREGRALQRRSVQCIERPPFGNPATSLCVLCWERPIGFASLPCSRFAIVVATILYHRQQIRVGRSGSGPAGAGGVQNFVSFCRDRAKGAWEDAANGTKPASLLTAKEAGLCPYIAGPAPSHQS
jgi:hypothetical protein